MSDMPIMNPKRLGGFSVHEVAHPHTGEVMILLSLLEAKSRPPTGGEPPDYQALLPPQRAMRLARLLEQAAKVAQQSPSRPFSN